MGKGGSGGVGEEAPRGGLRRRTCRRGTGPRSLQAPPLSERAPFGGVEHVSGAFAAVQHRRNKEKCELRGHLLRRNGGSVEREEHELQRVLSLREPTSTIHAYRHVLLPYL